jgi:hypothetical protein
MAMRNAWLYTKAVRITNSGLCLAATPVFAAMACVSATGGQDAMAMPTSAMQHASMSDGMAVMYALMGVFHAPPWLKLIGRRRRFSKPRLRHDNAPCGNTHPTQNDHCPQEYGS